MEGPITVAAARAHYAGGDSHNFDHVLRVTALAERIARAEGADLVVVHTAALLHDIGESRTREHHHQIGAALARELLRDQPTGFVAAVTHAIEAHRFRTPPAPQTLEAQVVFDADKLDALGAIGVARACAYAGERGNALWNTPWRIIATENGDAVSRPVALGDAYTPGHEFVYKLSHIADQLYTATARAIARERAAFMQSFFDRLDQEAMGLL